MRTNLRQGGQTAQRSNAMAPRKFGRDVLRPMPRKSPANSQCRPRCSKAVPHCLWLRSGLERETQLMPWIIADSVCAEVSRFLDVKLPSRYVAWLDAKAEHCYAGHRHFRKLMRRRGNAPRDWLYVFMRHWLASLLHLERPDLCCYLPVEFGNGKRLPHGTPRRINKVGSLRDFRPAPRDWDASRVIRHRRWAWLAALTRSSRKAQRKYI